MDEYFYNYFKVVLEVTDTYFSDSLYIYSAQLHIYLSYMYMHTYRYTTTYTHTTYTHTHTYILWTSIVIRDIRISKSSN